MNLDVMSIRWNSDHYSLDRDCINNNNVSNENTNNNIYNSFRIKSKK